MTTSLDDLAAELTDIRERLSDLEARAPGPAPAGTPDPVTFWALEGVQKRRSDHPETAEGMVLLAGSMHLPTGEPVEWQQAAATTELLETDWSGRAAALAALGHPVRLDLLQRILKGTTHTADLADELGSTGQLHHHLRQLVAAGWLQQKGRGSYVVPAGRVVPLLAILTAVVQP